MTVNFPNMDPEAYARQYASNNNVSMDEARKQLKAQYGDPTQQSSSTSSTSSSTSSKSPSARTISIDNNVQDVMNHFGFDSIYDAMEYLQNLWGDPEGYDETTTTSSSSSSTSSPSSRTVEADNTVLDVMDHFGYSADEARTYLRNLWGDPEGYDVPTSSSSSSSSSEDDIDREVRNVMDHFGYTEGQAIAYLESLWGTPVQH